MAFNAGDIVVYIKANLADFNKGVSEATGSMSQFGKSYVKSSQVVTGALAGVATAIAGVGTFAVKNASDMEMLRSSFDVLTGSVEGGAKMFKYLNDFASKTPFELQDLASATQTMLSFGLTSAQAQKSLQYLGDVSMGNKDKLQGLSLAFGQVQSTGRLMGQDLLQMINNGFNPLQQISKTTGKSMADLKKEMEGGAISADMVSQAFEDATKEGGLFYKGMDRGAQTLQGTMSTLSDVAKSTLRNLVGMDELGNIKEGSILAVVKQQVTSLIEYLSAHQQDIINFVQGIANWLKDNSIVAGAVAFGLLAGAIGSAVVAIWAFLWPALAVAGALGLVAYGVKALIDHFGGWDAVTKTLQPTLDTLKILLGFIWDAMKSLWQTIVTELWPSLQQLWALIEPVLIPALKFLGAVLGLALVGAIIAVIYIIKGLIMYISEMINFWVAVGNVVKTQILAMVDYYKTLYENIKHYIQTILDVFNGWKNGTIGIADGIKMIFSSMWDAIKNIFKSGVNNSIKPLNSMISGINKMSGGSVNIPSIPYLAEGGIVTKPTLAMIGEAGAEAVIPLDKMGGAGAGGRVDVSIKIDSPVDQATLRKYAEDIAEELDNILIGRGQQPIYNITRL